MMSSRMKIFLSLLLIAGIISAGLTFWLFAEKVTVDPVRQQYQKVFSEFGKTAEEMYSQYAAYGLDILQRHRIEGLRILKQYGQIIEALQPYMDADMLFLVCREHGARLEKLLEQFQPAAIADIHSQFGMEGLRYVLDNPEVYFLLKKYGDRLVELANAKGPIVFDLVKQEQPEFIELYYDDALFKAISRFGVDGLMAIKTYRGMATTVFELLADDPRLGIVFRKYGYQQVIPVLYYFYQTKTRATLFDQLVNFEASKLFQKQDDEDPEASSSGTTTQIPPEQRQLERANRALTQIYAQGHTFLRQFDVSENGVVTPRGFVSLTNLLEELLMVSSPDKSVTIASAAQKGASDSVANESVTCDQLTATLNILGLLPQETIVSKQTRCFYLRTGVAAITTRQGIEGLMSLDARDELVARYGQAVIPFVTEYGKEGVKLLQQTDGKILQLRSIYGHDLGVLTLQYGVEVLDLVNQFGGQMLDLIRNTEGEVIPYARKYGQTIFRILEQPEGKNIISLCPVFGEEILQYAAQYPDDFMRYLLKYGKLAVKAVREHGDQVVTLARKYGDDVIFYTGLYGNEGMNLASKGQPGVILLSVIPADFWQKDDKQPVRYSLPGAYFSLLTRYPRRFHQYIGLLGEDLVSVKASYAQLFFWTITSLLLLYIVYMGYKGIVRLVK
jgi:hypothetical protein